MHHPFNSIDSTAKKSLPLYFYSIAIIYAETPLAAFEIVLSLSQFIIMFARIHWTAWSTPLKEQPELG